MSGDTSYRQKRCKHGYVDIKQCDTCAEIAVLTAEVQVYKAMSKTRGEQLEALRMERDEMKESARGQVCRNR